LAPRARVSAPIATPTRSSRAGSQVAARAIVTGNAVAAPMTTPRAPSLNRMPGIPSRDTAPATNGRRPRRAGMKGKSRRGESPSSSLSCSLSVRRPMSWAEASSASIPPALTARTASSKACAEAFIATGSAASLIGILPALCTMPFTFSISRILHPLAVRSQNGGGVFRHAPGSLRCRALPR